MCTGERKEDQKLSSQEEALSKPVQKQRGTKRETSVDGSDVITFIFACFGGEGGLEQH